MRPNEFARRQRQVLNYLEKAAAILAEMEMPEPGKRGRRGPTIAENARQEAIIQVALNEPALTFEEIGQRFGISRQRVDQILKRNGIGSERTEQARLLRQKTKDEAAARARRRRLEKRAKELGVRICRICYQPIPIERDRRALTCSKRCKRLWAIARLQLDPEEHDRHRQSQARTIVAHPDNRSPAEIEWATRMVNGEQPPPNRRYIVSGSATEKALQEVAALREQVA
jgi:hypothetical protein